MIQALNFSAISKHYNIIRGSAVILAIQICGMIVGYITNVAVARTLGAFEYGAFAFAWTWMNLVAQLTQLGFNNAIVRLIPEYQVKREYDLLRGILFTAHPLIFTFGLLWGGIGVLFVIVSKGFLQQAYIAPLTIALATVPFVAIMVLHVGIGRATGFIKSAFFLRFVLLPGAPILVIGVFTFFGISNTASTLLTGTLVISAVMASYQYMCRDLGLRRLTGAAPVEERLAVKRKVILASWMRLSIAMFMANIGNTLLGSAHIIAVGLLQDPGAVGAFQAAARTASVISIPLLAINAFAAPSIARLYMEGKKGDLSEMVVVVTHIVFWPSALGIAVLVFFGKSVLSAFGPAFDLAYIPLVIMACGQLVVSGTGLVASLLSMTGYHHDTARVFLASAIIQLILLFILVPIYGMCGAAIATVLANVGCNLVLTALVRSRLHMGAHIFSKM